MNRIKKACAFLALFSLPLLANAHSAHISLAGGDILPNQDIEIFFKPLAEGIVYRVNCDIIDKNPHSKRNVTDIALYSADSEIAPSINGNPINEYWQAKISTRSSNHLHLSKAQSTSDSFIIRNLDTEDTLTVQNCKAKPIGNL